MSMRSLLYLTIGFLVAIGSSAHARSPTCPLEPSGDTIFAQGSHIGSECNYEIKSPNGRYLVHADDILLKGEEYHNIYAIKDGQSRLAFKLYEGGIIQWSPDSNFFVATFGEGGDPVFSRLRIVDFRRVRPRVINSVREDIERRYGKSVKCNIKQHVPETFLFDGPHSEEFIYVAVQQANHDTCGNYGEYFVATVRTSDWKIIAFDNEEISRKKFGKGFPYAN